MRQKNRFSTNNDINNPEHTSDMYISENDRLFGDNFATADYNRRKMENEKKKEKYKFRQNQLFERERKRWERLDYEYLRKENQSMMNKERNLVGRKNNPGMAFNPLNLQYDNSVQGEILKRRDEESKYRAWLRSINIDKHSNAGYNIINGEERTILEERLNKDIVPDLIQKNIEQINEMKNKVIFNNNNFYTRCNPSSPDLRRYRYDDSNSGGNFNGNRINKSTTPNMLNNNGGRFRAPVDFRDERNYYDNGNVNGNGVARSNILPRGNMNNNFDNNYDNNFNDNFNNRNAFSPRRQMQFERNDFNDMNNNMNDMNNNMRNMNNNNHDRNIDFRENNMNNNMNNNFDNNMNNNMNNNFDNNMDRNMNNNMNNNMNSNMNNNNIDINNVGIIDNNTIDNGFDNYKSRRSPNQANNNSLNNNNLNNNQNEPNLIQNINDNRNNQVNSPNNRNNNGGDNYYKGNNPNDANLNTNQNNGQNEYQGFVQSNYNVNPYNPYSRPDFC